MYITKLWYEARCTWDIPRLDNTCKVLMVCEVVPLMLCNYVQQYYTVEVRMTDLGVSLPRSATF